MGNYGRTYEREPKKQQERKIKERVIEVPKEGLVSSLCNEAGYNREGLDNIELESKIDLEPCGLIRKSKIRMTLGEELTFPEPYSLDNILEESKSTHYCYAFISGRKLVPAFTKVTKGERTKIKIKGKTERVERQGVILLKRTEKHLEELAPLDVNKEIAEIARKNQMPLKYVGDFLKRSKEAFVFNPTSGRVFVIATNLCGAQNKNQLYQLEIEYYGQVNGFSSWEDVYEEMAGLTKAILKDGLPRLNYSGRNSTLSKFEWLVKNA
jgi:hypothetical protein